MTIQKCNGCGLEKEHHGKGYCFNCYRKLVWDRKKGICKRCKREIYIHAKGLCPGCYNFVFHLDKTKAENYRKWHNLDINLYKKITRQCAICDFNKIVDLHHLDENKKNNSEQNLIGLCPNHHKMLHNFRFRKEIREILSSKGIILPKDEKIDFKLN
jgi:hypothetical protein